MRIIYTERHKLHATDNLRRDGNPIIIEELPARAEIILSALQAGSIGPVSPPTDHGLDPILAVHDRDFVDFLRGVHAERAARRKTIAPVFADTPAPRHFRRKPRSWLGLTGYYAFGHDDPIVAGTWEAAYWSAQCALSAVDTVRAGERAAYALCRPPGHHATVDSYGGFCYLNNAAIAARFLDAPVAILDIDYHHGNGTQEIFYTDPSVLFCSLHAHPDDNYPYYWGAADERGADAGEGFNRNWPLPQRTDDARYLATLEEALTAIDGFRPRALVLSAGLDIAADDPLGGFRVTADGFRQIGQRIAALNLPTVIVQEGGYLLHRLGENALALLQAFA
jgi:acetoin utilization deacetylase AcuC-like enzyme